MFKIESGFIGEFKTGDNINHNLSSLKILYDVQKSLSPSESPLLCKPITITLVSIIEALLHDLIFRMQNHTTEGVRNIAKSVLSDVRSKKLDKLATYIDCARKHDLLSASGTDLYAQLHELRKVRNRIHIQNVKRELPLDEKDVFTPECQCVAEEMVETIIKHVSVKHYRPAGVREYVQNFEIPWKEHLVTSTSH